MSFTIQHLDDHLRNLFRRGLRVPVWILLQPRDYLSSFLLYAMLAVILAIEGVVTIAKPKKKVA